MELEGMSEVKCHIFFIDCKFVELFIRNVKYL